MFRYVDLCVELKKGRYAKDGLIHYRNVCQQVNVSSLEEVIKYFLKTATNKAEAAQSKAAEVGILVSFAVKCCYFSRDKRVNGQRCERKWVPCAEPFGRLVKECCCSPDEAFRSDCW